jgi:hypothetical protein
LSFTFLFVIFSCGALLEYLVYLVQLLLSFLGWLITTTELKISARIHHMFLATFATIAILRIIGLF